MKACQPHLPAEPAGAATAESGVTLVRPDRLYAGYIFDLDGTIYLGDDLLPGTQPASTSSSPAMTAPSTTVSSRLPSTPSGSTSARGWSPPTRTATAPFPAVAASRTPPPLSPPSRPAPARGAR